jgi:hypothetical protein
MTMKRGLWLVLFVCAMANGLSAADDAFVGKWKLNPARSTLTDQMKVAAVGPNKYAFTFSGDNVETIVADGSDQPGLYGSTLAVIVDGDESWKIVRKTNGHTDIIGLWKLSDNGNTLTDNFTSYHANGSTFNLHYIYKRTEGTTGFPGTWESTTQDVNSSLEMQIARYQESGLSFIYPASDVTKSLNFDGKDYPNKTAKPVPGYASSAHRINQDSFEMVDKINGKELNKQKFELSADHKTITITATVPGQSKPNIQVFERE